MEAIGTVEASGTTETSGTVEASETVESSAGACAVWGVTDHVILMIFMMLTSFPSLLIYGSRV